MYFTSKEKQAIVKVAAEMQIADGNANQREITLNIAVFKEIQVEPSELDAGLELPFMEAVNIISNMTNIEKDFVSAFLGSIIIADGEINEKEIALWRMLTSLCGFPIMSLSDAKNKLKEHLNWE